MRYKGAGAASDAARFVQQAVIRKTADASNKTLIPAPTILARLVATPALIFGHIRQPDATERMIGPVRAALLGKRRGFDKKRYGQPRTSDTGLSDVMRN
jgi:hypothetical protein